MFTIGSNHKDSHFYIHDGKAKDCCKYLHCDGRVIDVCEYFESYGAAQAVIDKFYPKPEHVWENGDVFLSGTHIHITTPMIYIHTACSNKKDLIYSLDKSIGGPATNKDECMNGATFLFNIREKI